MRALRNRAACAVVVLSGLLTAGGASAQWKELGPSPLAAGTGGRVTALAGHPTDANVYYLGAASGGVWKFQNGTYTPLTDQMPFNAIGALAIDAKDPNVIYAGTGEPNAGLHAYYGVGVFKSTDGGGSWTVLGASTFGGRAVSRIVISPANSKVLFLSLTHNGLAYPGGVTAAKGHPGAAGPGGVFRSGDAGATWAQLAGGLPAVDASDVAIAPDGMTLYAAVGAALGSGENGVYKSTNGGDGWTKLGDGLPGGTGRITLALAPSDPKRLYAAIAGPGNDTSSAASSTVGIFVTSDSGATWTKTSAGNYMGSQGNYDNCAIVDPKNADVAYFGGSTQFVKTTNGGQSFSNISATHPDYHALAFLANGDMLVGQDGGVNRSTNAGSSWKDANAGLGVNQFYAGISLHPTNENFVLGGLQDNGTVIRGAGNATWRSVLGADGGYTALNPKAPDTMFAEFYEATSISRSTDGGRTFSPAASGISGGDRTAFYDVVIPTADPMVFLLGTHRVYKSTNAGASWTPISGDVTGGSPYAIRAMAVAPSNAQIVWVATNDHRVSVSKDGGVTFTKKLDAPGWRRVTREIIVAPWDDKTAFVAVQRFNTDQVRMTKDLGDTWTTIDGDLPDVPANTVDAAVVAGQNMVFVGTDAGVYFTCNQGMHWAKLGNNLPNTVVSDVRYDPAFKRVIASTMGRGVWTIAEPTAAACTGPGNPDGGTTTGTTTSTGAGGGSTAGTSTGSGAAGGASGAGGSATTGAGGSTTSAGGSTTSAGGSTTSATGTGGGGGAGTTGGGATGAGGSPTTGSTTGTTGSPADPGNTGGCACGVARGRGGDAFAMVAAGIGAALSRRRRRDGAARRR